MCCPTTNMTSECFRATVILWSAGKQKKTFVCNSVRIKYLFKGRMFQNPTASERRGQLSNDGTQLLYFRKQGWPRLMPLYA